MKIVVIGSGLIGSKTAAILRRGEARLGRIGLDEWLRRPRARA